MQDVDFVNREIAIMIAFDDLNICRTIPKGCYFKEFSKDKYEINVNVLKGSGKIATKVEKV